MTFAWNEGRHGGGGRCGGEYAEIEGTETTCPTLTGADISIVRNNTH
jgi:hypothetical protein